MDLLPRALFIGVVVALLMLGAWGKMLRSRTYATQPRWVRWAWTIFYWLLALVTGFLWLRLPA